MTTDQRHQAQAAHSLVLLARERLAAGQTRDADTCVMAAAAVTSAGMVRDVVEDQRRFGPISDDEARVLASVLLDSLGAASRRFVVVERGRS